MSPCEIAAGLLPDYWKDGLNGPERAGDRLWLREHLESCGECGELSAAWRGLGELRGATPDPGQRERFEHMLAEYAGRREARPGMAAKAGSGGGRWWHWQPALAAAALLVAGLAGGWWLRGTSSAPAASPASQQIAELREQVQATRQLAVLSLLQQQSASDRLQGITYGSRLQDDPKIADALLHSLKYDASPDVRLAALDALERGAGRGEIGAGTEKNLIEAFRYQKSPLVQIALVDSFVETRDRQARALLQQVSNDAAYNPEVRQRAAWGLAQPTWN